MDEMQFAIVARRFLLKFRGETCSQFICQIKSNQIREYCMSVILKLVDSEHETLMIEVNLANRPPLVKYLNTQVNGHLGAGEIKRISEGACRV
jgi:hypothetical protein